MKRISKVRFANVWHLFDEQDLFAPMTTMRRGRALRTARGAKTAEALHLVGAGRVAVGWRGTPPRRCIRVRSPRRHRKAEIRRECAKVLLPQLAAAQQKQHAVVPATYRFIREPVIFLACKHRSWFLRGAYNVVHSSLADFAMMLMERHRWVDPRTLHPPRESGLSGRIATISSMRVCRRAARLRFGATPL